MTRAPAERTIPPRVRLGTFPLPGGDELLLLALRDIARNRTHTFDVVYSSRLRMNG
ncbi:hypothetical protein ACFWRZ_08920 [Streptomyces rubiginosohelvolus]|uniref:hypothetical protein n=1 Tax=Streptomyces rubiginosohelvolus TaxID=67362 RepID=UPI003667CDCD